MKNRIRPIYFPKIGDSTIGYLSFGQSQNQVPFSIERVYWTYHTPESTQRGGHAHKETEGVLIALSGEITVSTENMYGEKEVTVLTKPNVGLYLPKMCWRSMQYSHSAVQLVLASTEYSVGDYIRDYDEFKSLLKN